MESSSSSIAANSLYYWNYFNLFLLRPILAISFALFFILLGWFLAWKLVLVHVPLIQEIFGMRKKPVNSKPPLRRRFSRFYKAINATNSASDW
ncbi:transmembrane protein [Citrus sinensis]|uniref:Transmembrane protein n=1 Tax=Citrus sinensis TaxID=2711 RepID=A0ACB8KR47_CITSI|nr:transmembrane protein [Citrus sinensis]